MGPRCALGQEQVLRLRRGKWRRSYHLPDREWYRRAKPRILSADQPHEQVWTLTRSGIRLAAPGVAVRPRRETNGDGRRPVLSRVLRRVKGHRRPERRVQNHPARRCQILFQPRRHRLGLSTDRQCRCQTEDRSRRRPARRNDENALALRTLARCPIQSAPSTHGESHQPGRGGGRALRQLRGAQLRRGHRPRRVLLAVQDGRPTASAPHRRGIGRQQGCGGRVVAEYAE